MKKAQREKILAISLVTICMALILTLVLAMYFIRFRSATLSLENTIERNYARMLMVSEENSEVVEHLMEDYGISGFGIFRKKGVNGDVLLGDAVELDRESLDEEFHQTNIPYYKKSDSIAFNEKTKDVRIIRSIGEVSDLYFVDYLSGSPIVYLSFNASEYLNTINSIIVNVSIFVAFTLVMYIVLLYIVLQNTKYRNRLNEQSTLVAMGEAARTLTHEIKNPLSGITLQLALLKRLAPKEFQEDLMVIDTETKKVTNLTNRVSEFLRNPLGSPRPLDLVEVINSLLPSFPSDVVFNQAGLKDAYVSFDPDRLKSVLENVIRNAVESTDLSEKQDYKDVEIKLNMTRFTHKYIVSVLDRGIGIKSEDLKKVFEPFFTTKVHGSGIGLAIVKQFMTASGALVEITNRKGGGVETKLTFNRLSQREKENQLEKINKEKEENESTHM